MLRAAGEREAAKEPLQRALALYEQKEHRVRAKRTRALLGDLAGEPFAEAT